MGRAPATQPREITDMSVMAMAWAWRAPVKNASERLVLIALADHSDDQGRCWPGQEGLAEKCCMHRVSVNRIVKRLADAGLIEIQHRAKEDGTRNSNLYRIPIQSNPESLWRANQSNPEYNQSNPEYGQSNSGLHKPSENHQIEPSDISTSHQMTSQPDRFDLFWQVYPKKVAKAEARKAWKQIKPTDPVLQQILDDIQWRLANDEQWQDRKYQPNPATYLRGRRWEDERETEWWDQHEADAERHEIDVSETGRRLRPGVDGELQAGSDGNVVGGAAGLRGGGSVLRIERLDGKPDQGTEPDRSSAPSPKQGARNRFFGSRA